jgi:site-specific DNA recombinase
MLIHPAYAGHAAFGRFHYLPPQPRLRAQRGRPKLSSHPVSRVPASREEWSDIPVPAVVDAATFEAVSAQLAENKIRKRDRETGHIWLLQGLTVCRRCGYAHYGKTAPRSREYDKSNVLRYYRCVGADSYRFQGQSLCCNLPVRADQLEEIVWDRVKALLQEPERVADEYRRRLARAADGAEEPEEVARVEKQIASVRRGIERLIDSYAEGFVEKGEFGPRITGMTQRMSKLQERLDAAARTAERERDFRLVVIRLENFAVKVSDGLDRIDRACRREIIRAMVKRIEVERGEPKSFSEFLRRALLAARAPRTGALPVGNTAQWSVERSFAWLGRCRRLARDWERLTRKAFAFQKLACVRLMIRKLCNPA